jgi:hypothetical protein
MKYAVLAVLAVAAIGIAVFFAVVVMAVQSVHDWIGDEE